MKLSVISFTTKGMEQSEKIRTHFPKEDLLLYTKCSAKKTLSPGVNYVTEKLGVWTNEQFEEKRDLLFIGACGIAVRSIAPYIQDKLTDQAVLVMDEEGQFVIPILSGHVGGANELAIELGKKMKAMPVITTATDVNHTFAVDVFAKKNELTIGNREGIARVSAKVLEEKQMTLSMETGGWTLAKQIPKEIQVVPFPPKEKVDVLIAGTNAYEATLYLHPKEYVLGVGCRKGKAAEELEQFLKKHMENAGITWMQVAQVSSIDLKKDEPALLQWSEKHDIPFVTYSSEELGKVDGTFSKSMFVEKTTGVDNVCERAAQKGCGEGGSLIYQKHAEDGMTIAIGRRKRSVSFDET